MNTSSPITQAIGPAPGAAIPKGKKAAANNASQSVRRKDAWKSHNAKCRPDASRIIASCTMVSSRCVAGLSTGMRAFSATATASKATAAKPSDTRNPSAPSWKMPVITSRFVVPARMAKISATKTKAGSASAAKAISRVAPKPPKAVPTSIPASAMAKRDSANSPAISSKSAKGANTMPRAKLGTKVAANTAAASAI